MEVIDRLRDVLLKGQGVTVLKRKFELMDSQRDGKITKEEFSQGLAKNGVVVSAELASQAFDVIDTDGSGTINIDEFFHKLRPQVPPARVAILKEAFDKMDTSGDGVVTADDIRGKYNPRTSPSYGEKSDEECLQQFLRSFDSIDKDGKITLDELVENFSDMSAAIKSDIMFKMLVNASFSV